MSYLGIREPADRAEGAHPNHCVATASVSFSYRCVPFAMANRVVYRSVRITLYAAAADCADIVVGFEKFESVGYPSRYNFAVTIHELHIF
jgi:hypothetical protein